jgi:hypothetical protein
VVEGTDFHAGCATAGAVTGGYDPDVLSRAEAALRDASNALAALFQQAGLVPVEAARRATLLVCAAEGAVILARARRSVEPLTLIAEQLGGSRSGAPGEGASARLEERASQSG